MDRNSIYYRQVQLLLQLIPFIARHDCFALKGGTAINLFVRDLPRLSVDIDLVFLPMLERDEALMAITKALTDIGGAIKQQMPDAVLIEAFRNRDDALRLTVTRGGVQIKIELSPVLRGTVFEPQLMSVRENVEDEFGFAEMQVVSHADLYAGKICAALDRQHPRDLFDVKALLENEGLTDELRKALIIYMISHNRPISELIQPRFKDISDLYHGEFLSMSEQRVELAELESVREQLVQLVNAALTLDERRFLLSFKGLAPEWELLGLGDVENLPAIRWKQKNLAKMTADKRNEAYHKLSTVLGIG